LKDCLVVVVEVVEEGDEAGEAEEEDGATVKISYGVIQLDGVEVSFLLPLGEYGRSLPVYSVGVGSTAQCLQEALKCGRSAHLPTPVSFATLIVC
jgi:hypothetical protein